MRRQLWLLYFALGALARRPGKSLALGAALTFVVSLYASTLMLRDAIELEYTRGIEGLPDLSVQRLVGGRPALIPLDAAAKIAALPAVRAVKARVFGYLYVRILGGNVTVAGVPVAPEVADTLSAGRIPRRAGEVAIGRVLAERLGLRAGDELGLPAAGELVFSNVVGIFRADSAIRTAGLVLATPEHARTLLGVPAGVATDLAVDLTIQSEAEVVTRKVVDQLPGARVLDKTLLARTYALTFGARSGLVAVFLLPALAAFLLLAWERLTGLGDNERREIGILKAVGWSTGDVMSARMWESGILGVAATALALGLAHVYVFVFGAPGLSDALLGWSNLYPRLALSPAWDPAQLLVLLSAVVVPFIAVSAVPAWRAASLDPDRALRRGG